MLTPIPFLLDFKITFQIILNASKMQLPWRYRCRCTYSYRHLSRDVNTNIAVVIDVYPKSLGGSRNSHRYLFVFEAMNLAAGCTCVTFPGSLTIGELIKNMSFFFLSTLENHICICISISFYLFSYRKCF